MKENMQGPDNQASAIKQDATNAAQSTAQGARKISGAVGTAQRVGRDVVAKGAKYTGRAAKYTGKGMQAAGKGLQAASNAAEPAMMAAGATVGAVIGTIIPGAGTAAGAKVGADIGQVAGKGTKVAMNASGKAMEAAGKGMETAGKGMEEAGKKMGALNAKLNKFLNTIGEAKDKLTKFLTLQGIKDYIKDKLRKLILKPKFWIFLAIVFVFMTIFFAMELIKVYAFEKVCETMDSLKQSIGKENLVKGYGTLAALSNGQFERVIGGVRTGVMEDQVSKASSEIPFFGMNARRATVILPTPKPATPVTLDGDALRNNAFPMEKNSSNEYTQYRKPSEVVFGRLGNIGSYFNELATGTPVYAAGVNANRNLELDRSSTEEERERIINYAQVERDSIFNAAIEEKEGFFASISVSFTSVLGELFPEKATGTGVTYGSGKNAVKQPRLTFLNDEKYDFNDDEMDKLVLLLKQVETKISLSPKNFLVVDGGNDLKNITDVKKQIETLPDPKKPEDLDKTSPMMDIKEKYFENNVVKDMKMGDALYKILEPYALDWKFLYTIDKAVEEDIFDNFSDILKSKADQKQIQDSLMARFNRVDIPKFMPQFRVLRHTARDYNYSWTETVSCSYSEEDGCSCSDPDIDEDESNIIKPIYMMDWLDILTKDQFMPTYEKLHVEYEEHYTTGECGSYTHSKSLKLKQGPEYYKIDMPINQTIPAVTTENRSDGWDKYLEFDYVLSYPQKENELPKRFTKREEIKNLFDKQYGLNEYDIRHALYLTDGNNYCPTARLWTAWTYGINLKNISNPNKYGKGNGGFGPGSSGDGSAADFTYLLSAFSGTWIDVMKEYQDEINQKAAQAGIPAAAWVAQMIQESRVNNGGSWDLSPIASSKHNLTGIQGMNFSSYSEYFDYYLNNVIIGTGYYEHALEAVQSGFDPSKYNTQPGYSFNQTYLSAAMAPGAEAYLYGLQDGTSRYCTQPDGFIYSESVIKVMYENQLKGPSGSSQSAYLDDMDFEYALFEGNYAYAAGGSSGVRSNIIQLAESMVGRLPYQSDSQHAYPHLGDPISAGIDKMDCSAFVQWVMINAMGTEEPFNKYRSTVGLNQAIQDGVLEVIDESEVQPGDIFLQKPLGTSQGGSSDHTGFCYSNTGGNFKLIHENGRDQNVSITDKYFTISVWCRLKGIGNYSGTSNSGVYRGVDIFKLQDSYFDMSKDKEIDRKYKGAPDPWAEDFATSGPGVTTGGSGNTTSTGKLAWPVDMNTNTITQPFKGENHHGIDLAPSGGSGNPDILAALDGEVTEVVTGDSIYGNFVRIRHPDSTETKYAHLSQFNVTKGAKVNQGQKIGVMGTTGKSSGVHLHFEYFVNGSVVDPVSNLPSLNN